MDMDYGYRTPSVEAFIDSLPSLTVAEWDRGIISMVREIPGVDRVSDAATNLIELTAHQDPVVAAQINAAKQAAWESMKQISWSQTNQNMVEGVLKAVSAIVILDIVPVQNISIALAPFRFSNVWLPVSWGSPDA
ncbi:hypothetical protein [Arthrobacter oryzae]|jgi:hypothetical protein|uniref:hypothetical protein n=1 Tax=Arthrobacter oryzae TaxID=409290 RepID=UPI0030C9792E